VAKHVSVNTAQMVWIVSGFGTHHGLFFIASVKQCTVIALLYAINTVYDVLW